MQYIHCFKIKSHRLYCIYSYRIREKDERGKALEKISISKEETDPYGNSTDEDNPPLSDTMPMNDTSNDNGSDSGLPDLPDFFTDKHFFFYGHFEPAEQRLLTRYIAAYNGYDALSLSVIVSCVFHD